MTAMADRSLKAIPIFRIFDVDKARAFYLDFLGMSVDWEHRFDESAPLYMQVSRGELKLHLTEHHGDCCDLVVLQSDVESVEVVDFGLRVCRFVVRLVRA